MKLNINKANRSIRGSIRLSGSKSISNRALIIRALSGHDFPIHRLANAQDTVTLNTLLQSSSDTLDTGPAGTTFRFLTAYLSLQKGSTVLTGSERMKQRPIGVLVEALRQLGADIDYLEKKGYPPLKINSLKNSGDRSEVAIPASVSSQYISALLMIAPTLPHGLTLRLTGKIVSRPYIQMTLNLMAYFGISYTWEGNTISIAPQPYQNKPFTVEADWSAASYYYALAAFADDLDLELKGLFEESVQGDAVIAKMMEHFGIHTAYTDDGIRLTKQAIDIPPFDYDFLECPDLAQTVAVICGGLGVSATFTGLETLKIKETDRVDALFKELKKVGVDFIEQADGACKVSKKADLTQQSTTFATYEDHRMAMAFAPLALFGSVFIEEPDVVKKSYPDFWKDLEKLGFIITF